MRLLVPTLVLAALVPAQNESPPTLSTLVQDLGSGNTQTWHAARYKLVQAGGESVPLLIPQLRSETEELRFLRIRVLDVLGRIGADAEAARPALEKVMGGADRHLGDLAARSLVQIDPKHPAAIRRLLQCGDPVSMMIVCRALGRGGASALPRLEKMIQSRHRGVRTAAGQALARLVADPNVEIPDPVLLSMLEIDSYPVRRAAMVRLGDMSNPPKTTADRVRPLLASTDNRERVAAIECLSALDPQPPWFLEALVARTTDRYPDVQRAARVALLLHDPDAVKRLFATKGWQNRQSAAKILRWVQVEDESSPAIRLLVRLLQDPEPEVRGTAATSLGELAPHSRQAITELKLALRDRQAGVRRAALSALAAFRRHEVPVPEAEMAALIDDKDIAVRAEAIRVLPTLRLETPLLNKLIHCLGDEGHVVREAAFHKLRKRVQASDEHKPDIELRRRAFAAALALPDAQLRRQARSGLRSKRIEPNGEEFLLQFLEHDNPMVRVEAATTFGEMEGAAKTHLPKLERLLEDPDPRVRGATERAIAEIQGTVKKGPGIKRLKLK